MILHDETTYNEGKFSFATSGFGKIVKFKEARLFSNNRKFVCTYVSEVDETDQYAWGAAWPEAYGMRTCTYKNGMKADATCTGTLDDCALDCKKR